MDNEIKLNYYSLLKINTESSSESSEESVVIPYRNIVRITYRKQSSLAGKIEISLKHNNSFVSRCDKKSFDTILANYEIWVKCVAEHRPEMATILVLDEAERQINDKVNLLIGDVAKQLNSLFNNLNVNVSPVLDRLDTLGNIADTYIKISKDL